MQHFQEHYKHYLKNKVPDNAFEPLLDLLKDSELALLLEKKPSGFYGRFKAGRAKLPCILMRNNLNKYHFLYIFIHELAHYFVWKKYKGRRVKPHGIEWKDEKTKLLSLFLNKDFFPAELEALIIEHMETHFMGKKSKLKLSSAFLQYDTPAVRTLPADEKICMIKDLNVGDCFSYRKQFYKVVKFNRTRVLCKRFLTDKKVYSFYQLLSVKRAFQD
ncbi:MAG: hypothetical protein PHT69_16825 [Bacteroidales bacterium]|nr:hypothetical protein [Bacteroidales bacterium]